MPQQLDAQGRPVEPGTTAPQQSSPGLVTLSAEREAEVIRQLQLLRQLPAEFDNLEKCGTECTAYRDEAARVAEQLQEILDRYGRRRIAS